MDPIVQSLCKTTFLAVLNKEQCSALSKVVRSRKLRVHESLFNMGDSGDYLAILITGQLSVRMTGSTPMAAIYPGEVVGEMACVDPAPRSANVVATKESTVVEISRTILGALQEKAPRIAVGIVGEVINLLARRVRDTNDRIENEMEARGIKTALTSDPDSISSPQTSAGTAADKRIDLRTVTCLQGFKQTGQSGST
ncbi:MAG TPA: Crp/Fnr family transcriptional regulator [Myxococcales bacterium]|nr:Crp/Fnr family transcriptional regulator [Myxococcales bacterium]